MIHNINPIFISISDFHIYWYGVMYLIAFLIAWFLGNFYIKNKIISISSNEFSDLLFYIFLGVFIGGRLGYSLLYNFSITIENAILPGYWTEKLLDAFATKSLPIYYGDKNSVSKFFDPEGIIFFESIDELNDILSNLSVDFYNKRKDAIDKNFELVEEFRVPEDWIYKQYKFLFE